MKFTNNPNLKFASIDVELWREYDFMTGSGDVVTLRIDSPVALNVSSTGGHRIIDKEEVAWYIPYKWFALRWMAKKGAPRIVF